MPETQKPNDIMFFDASLDVVVAEQLPSSSRDCIDLILRVDESSHADLWPDGENHCNVAGNVKSDDRCIVLRNIKSAVAKAFPIGQALQFKLFGRLPLVEDLLPKATAR